MANTAWNPSDLLNVTLSGSNLVATPTGQGLVRSVDSLTTGKFYWECAMAGANAGGCVLGAATRFGSLSTVVSTGVASAILNGQGTVNINGAQQGATGLLGASVANVPFCAAVDFGAMLIWFRNGASGNWNGSATANPATGVGGFSIASLGISPGIGLFACCGATGANVAMTADFGGSAFVGAVPSGFTSGFTAGLGPTATSAVVTQTSVEHFVRANPALQVTQVSIEHFIAPSPSAQVTQVALEEWATPNSVAQVTQVALEEWGTVALLNRVSFALADAVETAAFALNTIPPAAGSLHFALADAFDNAAFNIEHTPVGSRIVQFFGLQDAVETAAFTISTAPNINLAFAANDAVETAAFSIAHHRFLAFALNDAVEAAHFRIATIGDMMSFNLNDAVETASFTLVETWLLQSAQLPTFSGVGWPVNRRPTWRTTVMEHPSGGERRTAYWSYPLWEFELTLDGLTSSATQFHGLGGTSFQELLGFYLAQGGQLNSFLYFDPDFNTETGGPCGTGDGTTTDFLFMRTVGGAAEPASWLTGTPTVYLNGVAQPLSAWRLVLPNNLVFINPPPAGAVITADFAYLFHCHFAEDTTDYQQQMIHLFDLKSLKFRQVRDT